MTSPSVLDRFGPKVEYQPMTFKDTRQRFLDGYHEAVKALDAGNFKDAQRRGWLTVNWDEDKGSWKFLVRPGYGENNQWVPNTDPRVRKDRWIATHSEQEARQGLDELFALAETGFWDVGLKAIFKRNQEMVEKRKPQLDAYQAKSLEANTLPKYGIVANENESDTASNDENTVLVPLRSVPTRSAD